MPPLLHPRVHANMVLFSTPGMTPPPSFPFLQLITSPGEENTMYVQQRDEYLESVCEMAIRKVSIITIFGSLTNSTMKIDHYQLGRYRDVSPFAPAGPEKTVVSF